MTFLDYLEWRSRFAEANDPEFYPIQWLDAEIAAGRADIIAGEKSAIIVQAKIYPGGAKVGQVHAAVGDMAEIVNELAPRAEEWGREHGCTLAEIEGRDGWKRVLKSRGWQAHQTVLMKDL